MIYEIGKKYLYKNEEITLLKIIGSKGIVKLSSNNNEICVKLSDLEKLLDK